MRHQKRDQQRNETKEMGAIVAPSGGRVAAAHWSLKLTARIQSRSVSLSQSIDENQTHRAAGSPETCWVEVVMAAPRPMRLAGGARIHSAVPAVRLASCQAHAARSGPPRPALWLAGGFGWWGCSSSKHRSAQTHPSRCGAWQPTSVFLLQLRGTWSRELRPNSDQRRAQPSGAVFSSACHCCQLPRHRHCGFSLSLTRSLPR